MVKITIKTENAAFDPYPGEEIIRILKTVIQAIRNGDGAELILRDINGNNVGTYEYTKD